METLEATKPKVKKLPILKILPYINTDADADSVGAQLTKYNLVLHDGANYREQLTYLERNGVRRYLTGLNEYAPEVENIQDPDKKSATIREIRKKVVFLEKALSSNVIKDIDDPDFWNKVKTVHPTNHVFWNDIFIEPGNEPVFLNPEDPYDLVKICGIEAGGFSVVGKSYEDAKMSANPPKFYLDRANDTASTKVEVKKLKNKALASLTEMFQSNPKKLFYVVKNIDSSNSYQYKNSTSNDIIYDYLDNYISGEGYEKSAKKAAIFFNDVCALSEDELRIKAVIADANFYKMIAGKGDGLYYHRSTDTMLGKNMSDMVAYFKDSMNSKVWEKLYEEVEVNWKD